MANHPNRKLTPALRRWLEFIAEGGDQGRMELQITSCGGRSASQLARLRQAGWIETMPLPPITNRQIPPERIRITAAGKQALAPGRKEPLSYRRDGYRYIVLLGSDRLGFVGRNPDDPRDPRWYATDTTMAYSRTFQSRDAAGTALLRRFLRAQG